MNEVFQHMVGKDGEPASLLEYAAQDDSDSDDAPLTSLVKETPVKPPVRPKKSPVKTSAAPKEKVDLACPLQVDLSCPSSISELMAFFQRVKDAEDGEANLMPEEEPAVAPEKPLKPSVVPMKSAVKPPVVPKKSAVKPPVVPKKSPVKQKESPVKPPKSPAVPNVSFLGSVVLPSGFAWVSSFYL